MAAKRADALLELGDVESKKGARDAPFRISGARAKPNHEYRPF